MSKKKPKIDYEVIKKKVDELSAKAKAKTITKEERVELAEKREQLRHHNEAERIKTMAAAIAAGKRDALFKILDANGIKSENQLKEIFLFVKEAKPELLSADAPKPDSAAEEKGAEETDAAPDPESKPERKDDGESEDAPKCENCGAVLVEKTAKNGKRFLGCPNWHPGETHSSKNFE